MLKEVGRVAAIDHDALWVETIQRSTCGSCAAKKGCGQSLLTHLGATPVYLRVLLAGRPSTAYQVNDTVTIGIPDEIVVRGSLLIYLLPLILMLVFVGVAHTYLNNEIVSISAGFLGFIGGGLLVKWHAYHYRNDVSHQPFIVDGFEFSSLSFSTPAGVSNNHEEK
jgi:sigma-E factor negative regulatory protein RseC